MLCAELFAEKAKFLEDTESSMPAIQPTIDWQRTGLTETISGKVSGALLLKGTRMPMQTILDNLSYGMTAQEIAETWRLELKIVQRIAGIVQRNRARSA